MLEPKFLIDANMPRSSAEVMRFFGYDVEDVREIGMRVARDQEIIQYALKTKRIIVTRDTDFGEVLRYPYHPGAIIIHLPCSYTSHEINKILNEFLKSIKSTELSNAIIIIELGRYRRRPL